MNREDATMAPRRPAVDDELHTPNEWESAPVDEPHDHKGYSEEKCLRCGWVMGHIPLNCMNDDTPHRFPSQEAEIERLRAEIKRLRSVVVLCPRCMEADRD